MTAASAQYTAGNAVLQDFGFPGTSMYSGEAVGIVVSTGDVTISVNSLSVALVAGGTVSQRTDTTQATGFIKTSAAASGFPTSFVVTPIRGTFTTSGTISYSPPRDSSLTSIASISATGVAATVVIVKVTKGAFLTTSQGGDISFNGTNRTVTAIAVSSYQGSAAGYTQTESQCAGLETCTTSDLISSADCSTNNFDSDLDIASSDTALAPFKVWHDRSNFGVESVRQIGTPLAWMAWADGGVTLGRGEPTPNYDFTPIQSGYPACTNQIGCWELQNLNIGSTSWGLISQNDAVVFRNNGNANCMGLTDGTTYYVSKLVDSNNCSQCTNHIRLGTQISQTQAEASNGCLSVPVCGAKANCSGGCQAVAISDTTFGCDSAVYTLETTGYTSQEYWTHAYLFAYLRLMSRNPKNRTQYVVARTSAGSACPDGTSEIDDVRECVGAGTTTSAYIPGWTSFSTNTATATVASITASNKIGIDTTTLVGSISASMNVTGGGLTSAMTVSSYLSGTVTLGSNTSDLAVGDFLTFITHSASTVSKCYMTSVGVVGFNTVTSTGSSNYRVCKIDEDSDPTEKFSFKAQIVGSNGDSMDGWYTSPQSYADKDADDASEYSMRYWPFLLFSHGCTANSSARSLNCYTNYA
jgi:hypothetical protein